MRDRPPEPPTAQLLATRLAPWAGPVLLFLLLLLPLTTASVWGYTQQKALIRQRVLESLELLAFHKRQAIYTWQQRCLRDAAEVLTLPELGAETLRAAAGPGPARQATLDALDAFAKSRGFQAAALAGSDGQPLDWSRVGAPAFACVGTAAYLETPGGTPTMGPMQSISGGPCRVELTVPIPPGGAEGQAISAVLLAVDARQSLLREVSLVSIPQGIDGAILFLAQRRGDGVDLVIPARLERCPPLSVREAASPESLGWRAAQGQIDRGEGRGLDGMRVLYAAQYIPGTGWGLVAQMEEKAAFAALRETRWMVAGVNLLGGLFGLAALYAWWRRRHEKAQAVLLCDLREQKDRLSETVRKLFTAQETERRRLSYDIHDQFLQYLMGARLKVETLRESRASWDGDQIDTRLDEINGELTALSKEARAVIRRTRPPELDALGLHGAALSLEEQYCPMKIHLDVGPPEEFQDLPWATTLALYRTAQEALTNIKKHAGVAVAHLSLNRIGEEVVLSVADFGNGFDIESMRDASHFGLPNMAERIGLVGGTFTADSRPGGPTLVHARVPIHGGTPETAA